ncbi:putative retrotransposon hot spot (RHS) protein, partial [Trypanosoma conorhini]
MPGRREEQVHAAAEGNPATDVPQGQYRARSGPGSDTRQPAAQRRRVEEAPPALRWTLASTVEEVLLEGSVRPDRMKLNDFLRSQLDGVGVEPRNESVSMEDFLAGPGTFITSEGVLDTIKKTELFKSVEEARKLAGQGVSTLQHWRGFARRGAASPQARGNLDAALDAAVEEEARQRREELEKLPRGKMMYRSVYEAKWGY